MKFDLSYFKGKKILITGHTGFKGSWLSYILWKAGAEVTGYSLQAPTEPSLFEILKMDEKIHSVIGDVRDLEKMQTTFVETEPEIVIHLAAQPIVRESYRDPVDTYSTNVMGTVHVCECVRQSKSVKSFLNVTTDKVYLNDEKEGYGYQEDDKLDGYDPYSNSKSCSELVTHSYINSFFKDLWIAVSTARAGNVIGGGDFAKDRIIPDCFRAAEKGDAIHLRNPYSTRPYQHVLEPLAIYLLIVKSQLEELEKLTADAEKTGKNAAYPSKAGYYNVGPDDCDCVTTGELATLFTKAWGDGLAWVSDAEENAPHEANFLKLNSSKVKRVLGYQPTWHIDQAVEKSAAWYKAFYQGKDLEAEMDREIEEFFLQ